MKRDSSFIYFNQFYIRLNPMICSMQSLRVVMMKKGLKLFCVVLKKKHNYISLPIWPVSLKKRVQTGPIGVRNFYLWQTCNSI